MINKIWQLFIPRDYPGQFQLVRRFCAFYVNDIRETSFQLAAGKISFSRNRIIWKIYLGSSNIITEFTIPSKQFFPFGNYSII